VATAIHLRFDIQASSLPDIYKERLLALRDKRITKEGVIVIKAQQHRTQKKIVRTPYIACNSSFKPSPKSIKCDDPPNPLKIHKKDEWTAKPNTVNLKNCVVGCWIE